MSPVGTILLKVGGELVEDPAHLGTLVSTIRTVTASGVALVVVHGGGREIDAALKTAGIVKRQVDGLRITDEPTLDIVVAVLAGAVNTRFVAALGRAGVAAVGLTGADDGCGMAKVAPPHRTVDGREVELGRVGVPLEGASTRLLDVLLREGFVPVVSSIGVAEDGRLLNVNADTCAGHLAAGLRVRRLVIAGATPGVLDDSGHTMPVLESDGLSRLVTDGTATAGMIAKLRACEHALASGVNDVVIVDGRDQRALETALRLGAPASATQIRALSQTTS